VPFHYKGLTFSDAVGPFVRHMPSVNDHRESLQSLQGAWDMLSLLGHLSNVNADMTATREAFDRLTGELMACLGEETLARSTSSLSYTAQVAIDILIRNLFERTADIGFLATDTEVVAAAASRDPQLLSALRERIRAYARRYTVYRDIVLMAPGGEVLVRMCDGFAGVSASPIVAHAAGGSSYVESFGPTDFCGGVALTYSSAVRANANAVVGVIALEFDLATEAQTVFRRLAGSDDLLAFVDADGRIVASNDELRLPRGHAAPRIGDSPLVRLAGHAYVAVQRRPQPYQGYAGPGWSAIALIPADIAFEHTPARSDAKFSGEGVFSPRLMAVPAQAAAIQSNLDRIVWNGRLQRRADDAGDNFSRALLAEIASTGRRTKGIFEAATNELLDTVTSSVLDEAKFLSGLAVDILDRNLFERACDCRWWAENSTLATLATDESVQVLAYINALYTVYTNILLFDADGVVVASSREPSLVGTRLEQAWVTRCLALRDPMAYTVSPFEPSALYGDRSTYVYCAALLDGARAIGGVALVFDSAPQFEAMLEAALPSRAGSLGAFLRADGTLLASTGELPLHLPADVLQLKPGESWSGVVSAADSCFVVGATAGSGYREFKISDGYVETVISVVVVPCGQPRLDRPAAQLQLQSVRGGQEVATFCIGSQVVGLLAQDVVECIEVRKAVRLPGAKAAGARLCGYTTWRDQALPLVDLSEALGESGASYPHAIVMNHHGTHFGLLVSDLGAIVDLEVCAAPTTARLHPGLGLVTRIAKSGAALVPLLSAACVAELSIALRSTTSPVSRSAEDIDDGWRGNGPPRHEEFEQPA